MDKYKCPSCGWIGLESDMESNWFYFEDGDYSNEGWTDFECPKCHMWHNYLDDYEKVNTT